MANGWRPYIYRTEEEILSRRGASRGRICAAEEEIGADLPPTCLFLDDGEVRRTIPRRRGLVNPVPAGDGRSITTLSSREVYRNHWMRVREDEILRSNGQKGIYGVVDKDESAIILPLDGDCIWLVEQFRYTIQERALELPQGGWEMAIADPEELARGELREELGLDAACMTHLGSLWIAYGFTHQLQHVFLATGLTPVGKDPDAEEHDLTAHRLTVAKFEAKMLAGEIRDNCTLSAWGLYLLWKSRQAEQSTCK
jgi:8-oxo-dGTP pyrophosphatase MutT (NUDIX family)